MVASSWHAHQRLTLTETFRASLIVPSHSHDSSRLCFLLNGGFTEQTDGTSSDAALVRCSFIRAMIARPTVRRRRSRCLTVQLGQSFASRVERLGVTVPSRPITVQRKAAWLAMSLYEEFRQPDSASDLAIEGLCLTLLAALTREAASSSEDVGHPRWLRLVQRLLEERPVAKRAAHGPGRGGGRTPRSPPRVFHQRRSVT